MTKTQELKERIYKHCPELKQLGFGCQVAYEGAVGNPYIWHVAMCLGITAKGSAEVWNSFIQYIEPEKLRILGHPIHLEHVLRAINSNKKYFMGINANGTIEYGTVLDEKPEMVATGVVYNLSKTFDQNIAENPELVDFLLSIIKE